MAVARAARVSSPISRPGPRLLRGLPRFFQRFRQKRGGRALGIELPLLSLIDVLLCLVAFLLTSFSAEATCPLLERVPTAANANVNTEAPLVTISSGLILVDGSPAGSSVHVLEAGRLTRIDALYTILNSKRELWKALNPDRAFPGVVTLVVDRELPALVVKSALQTVAFAGYPNVGFLVKRR